MKSFTRVGLWLERHGWVLIEKRPHGFATTHFWEKNAVVMTQSYALIRQRADNRNLAAQRRKGTEVK